MLPIRKALARFSPWLTIVAVYVVLGLAGRTLLWARFGIEADVGASRLPYVLTAGFINDLVESLYLFAPLRSTSCWCLIAGSGRPPTA